MSYYAPKTTHYREEHWWRRAVRKAGHYVVQYSTEADPMLAMVAQLRASARAEAAKAQAKIAAMQMIKGRP